jgi:hypothetical protein
MRCWESPGDLPLVIENCVSFRSFRCSPLAKRHKISITRGRSPGLSQEFMHEYTRSMHLQTLHKRPSLLARGDLISGPKCKHC